MPFPLSDACALLLRLQMFNENLGKGELRERWRELGQGGRGNYPFFPVANVN